jgi:hypothetical protein
MIYDKTLVANESSLAGSEAVTLMSADIDRIGVSLPLIHEIYASPIEASLAIWLLYRLLGTALSAPIALIICEFLPSACITVRSLTQ